MGMGQNLVPLVNIKIAGKWMFIPLEMVLIGIDPYPYHVIQCNTLGYTYTKMWQTHGETRSGKLSTFMLGFPYIALFESHSSPSVLAAHQSQRHSCWNPSVWIAFDRNIVVSIHLVWFKYVQNTRSWYYVFLGACMECIVIPHFYIVTKAIHSQNNPQISQLRSGKHGTNQPFSSQIIPLTICTGFAIAMSDYQRIIWCPTVVSNAVLFMLVLNLNMVVYQSHVPQNLMSSEWSILELYNIDYRYQKKTQHGY